MHNTVANDSLLILGIAKDDSLKLIKFVKREQIPYANALADEKIISDYGVMGYPTTFLIDPESNVLVKGLRGSKIVETVRAEMKKYYSAKKKQKI